MSKKILEVPASIRVDELRSLLSRNGRDSVHVYRSSFQESDGQLYVLVRRKQEKRLVIIGTEEPKCEVDGAFDWKDTTVYVCPLSSKNAEYLRETFSWLRPQPLGRQSAIGCGDRLGLATPGHIRACRSAGVLPVLAQQSIREMKRTGRCPQEVLDDACWAAFQEGYTDGFGADADHLKTKADIDVCVGAGYTMYTIDPSDHVDDEADHLEGDALSDRFRSLPWDVLETTPEACLDRYTGEAVDVEGRADTVSLDIDAEMGMRAAVKYGAAIAHTKRMASHLAAEYEKRRAGEDFDLEMSVDETSSPTRPHEHYFVAAELERLGIKVTSLAPRFVGSFEKGIDFVGDLEAFEDSFTAHAAIAKANGGYKLSIHSGSDKFSVYPIIGRHAGDYVHLKTAGTSFLEALRIPARHAPDFFRRIVGFAFDRFDEDRKTYHVTTDLDVIPAPEGVSDDALEDTYLEEENGRQLLHITYGSILSAVGPDGPQFRDRLFELLNRYEEEHYDVLETHFLDHIGGVEGMARHGA